MKVFQNLSPELSSEIESEATTKAFEKGTSILEAGQYVKVIPLVLKGLVKVYMDYKDKELLLYYISPQESCVMSFAAGLQHGKSKVNAIIEEDSELLLLPAGKVEQWIKKYPHFNNLFFEQYNQRYGELLETIQHLLFDNMEKRVFDFLQKKISLTNQSSLKIAHRQIASELGTAREVVSRVIKKLENENKLKQSSGSIELL